MLDLDPGPLDFEDFPHPDIAILVALLPHSGLCAGMAITRTDKPVSDVERYLATSARSTTQKHQRDTHKKARFHPFLLQLHSAAFFIDTQIIIVGTGSIFLAFMLKTLQARAA